MAEVMVAAEQIMATMISTTLSAAAPVQFKPKTPNVKITAMESQIVIVAIVRAELSPNSPVIAAPSLLTHGMTNPSEPNIIKPMPTPLVIDAVKCWFLSS
jgi:hypothetical protein